MHRHPRLHGGFVWEWRDHGILTTTPDGTPYYAYGGDFGEVVHDGNFVMDGMLLSDDVPTPGLHEYKAVVAAGPLRLRRRRGRDHQPAALGRHVRPALPLARRARRDARRLRGPGGPRHRGGRVGAGAASTDPGVAGLGDVAHHRRGAGGRDRLGARRACDRDRPAGPFDAPSRARRPTRDRLAAERRNADARHRRVRRTGPSCASPAAPWRARGWSCSVPRPTTMRARPRRSRRATPASPASPTPHSGAATVSTG